MSLLQSDGMVGVSTQCGRTFSSLAHRNGDAESLESLFQWLERNGLVHPGGTYDARLSPDGTRLLSYEATVLGLPCRREERRSRAELDRIKERYAAAHICHELKDRDKIWQEIRHPGDAIRGLDLTRIPADAMAFYRFFHCPPFDQWGIYIIVPRLLDHYRRVTKSLGSLASFTPETLAVCVLFEIFHHEFFHHLVEAAATTIEIFSAAAGRPQPLFREYLQRSYERNLGPHMHTPLEEALANAYAYNAFSFISRVRSGYIPGMVSLYQEAMKAYWSTEPEGYRYAEHYIKGGYVSGAAQLLAMLVGRSLPEGDDPLLTVARAVFPSGHTAFLSKPDIPTYLVGSPDDLAAFDKLVPAPNESYTSLFWPVETKELDEFIQQKKKEERDARRRAEPGKDRRK